MDDADLSGLKPLPPGDLISRKPRFHTVDKGAELFRYYWLKNRDGMTEGSPDAFSSEALYRFDCPFRNFGVLYLAADPQGAFAEVFGRHAAVSEDFVRQKGLARFTAGEKLKFVALYGPGLLRVRATADVTSCGDHPYRLSQHWSNVIHELNKKWDGIAYYSRHDNQQICFALFQRAHHKVKVEDRKAITTGRDFKKLARDYGVTIEPSKAGAPLGTPLPVAVLASLSSSPAPSAPAEGFAPPASMFGKGTMPDQ